MYVLGVLLVCKIGPEKQELRWVIQRHGLWEAIFLELVIEVCADWMGLMTPFRQRNPFPCFTLWKRWWPEADRMKVEHYRVTNCNSRCCYNLTQPFQLSWNVSPVSAVHDFCCTLVYACADSMNELKLWACERVCVRVGNEWAIDWKRRWAKI